jgi:hypothetical protein
MIGDVTRTGTYRKAILGNAAVAITDKTVLDLGAGECAVGRWGPASACDAVGRVCCGEDKGAGS